ncbi:Disintegrin and metalloproteinase domain-containing protein 32 [Apodemus speciosus]|uniref:Disintegrin and metalloproteinase domain-containing protein 32 n=1 Tax=Apodemus speciosus TaxID=105296 RepID=A0ABQ0FR69_APOSI
MLGAMLYTLLLLLAELGDLLASGPDSQRSFLEIIFPKKIEDKTNSEIFFNKSGFLQFENVSYGIEPLESTSQHIVYKLGNEEKELLFNKHSRNIEMPTNYGILINKKPKSSLKNLFPLYLEMSIVVDKALVFAQLKVTIVLSSLELWSDTNKIPTVGEADELLHRFLEWKQSYLTLRPHDVAYLFIYNEYPNYVGATYPGKMCTSHYSAGITMYPKDMTLEAFSVILTQMLGLSLGLSYDDPAQCQCSAESICVMNPRAMQYAGVKSFSNCSLNDFEHFKSNEGAKCLQNKPQMQRQASAVCGNGRVEGNEICDCGSEQECGPDSCCEPTRCVLKPGNVCDSSSSSSTCCRNCQYLPENHECRTVKHMYCDVPEVCNGSSGQCPRDVIIHNGNPCGQGGSICYNGDCPNLDRHCQATYGAGSMNAPFSCYEEIQGQNDRFGNCGKDSQNRYKFCGWRNLVCGRLICTYPSRVPYIPPNNKTASVIYAFVRDKVCISVDFGSSVKEDPLKVSNGAVCDLDRVSLYSPGCSGTHAIDQAGLELRNLPASASQSAGITGMHHHCPAICLNGVCVESRFLKAEANSCADQCNGNGLCAHPLVNAAAIWATYLPTANFLHQMIEGRHCGLASLANLPMEGASKNQEKKWLLSLYIVLIILTSAVLIGTGWKGLKQCRNKEEESTSSESRTAGCRRSKSEDNSHTSDSRSKSETSSTTPTSRSKSETSSATPTSRLIAIPSGGGGGWPPGAH